MADIGVLARRAQIGVETTEGTEVNATKILPNFQFTLDPQMNFKTYSATGSKFTTSVVPGSEWTEGEFEGPLSFGEIIYPLSSIANYAAPVTALGASTWTFTPGLNTADTTKSFTLEIGSTAAYEQVLGLFFNGITFTFSPEDAEVKGSFIGKETKVLTSGFTNASMTTIENKVANATKTELYYASSFAGLSSGTLVTRAFNAELSIEDKYGTFKAMNASNSSYTGRMEKMPDAKLVLTLGAEYTGSDFVEPITLADARAGTTNYLRLITTTTEVIGTSALVYTFQVDMACKVTKGYAFGEQDDVLKNVEWELTIVEDATSSKAIEFKVINATSAL